MGRDKMQAYVYMCVFLTLIRYCASWLDSSSSVSNSSSQHPDFAGLKFEHALASKTSTASFKFQHFHVLLSLAYEMQISSVRFKNTSCMEQTKFSKAAVPCGQAQRF